MVGLHANQACFISVINKNKALKRKFGFAAELPYSAMAAAVIHIETETAVLRFGFYARKRNADIFNKQTIYRQCVLYLGIFFDKISAMCNAFGLFCVRLL